MFSQFSIETKQKLSPSKKKTSKDNSETNEEPPVKKRKPRDRFNGMKEDEVCKLLLPDRIALNLDILIIGINPGLFSAYKGHHYSNPGNHFWKCLYLSGFTDELIAPEDDCSLLNYGIGLTNMVERTTRGSNDLTTKELKEGSVSLLQKLQYYKPKIAVFNGKQIYNIYSKKKSFRLGKQDELVEGTSTYIWVMPSSSARFASLPRAEDKVPYFTALKEFLNLVKTGKYEEGKQDFTFDELKSPRKKSVKSE